MQVTALGSVATTFPLQGSGILQPKQRCGVSNGREWPYRPTEPRDNLLLLKIYCRIEIKKKKKKKRDFRCRESSGFSLSDTILLLSAKRLNSNKLEYKSDG